MELLGSAYFREHLLVQLDAKSSSCDRERIVREISGKIARQWFGVLVTMEFWTDAWISYGLSRYVEGYAFPETYHLAQQFNGDVQEALKIDSCPTSHPVVVQVDTPEEVGAVSDEDIVYTVKGAAILRWIESILGFENFRVYMRKFVKDK